MLEPPCPQYNCYLHNVNKVALFRRVVDRQELKVSPARLLRSAAVVQCMQPVHAAAALFGPAVEVDRQELKVLRGWALRY